MRNKSDKKRVHCEITERDYKILRFIWKWKAVSTMALAQRFFPDVHPFSAYRRLLLLKSDDYIGLSVVNGRYHEVWVLKEKGFRYILPHLGDLQSQGYKSANYHHDFLASAFHLGDWLLNQPNQSQTYSEQQLRCYPPDLWPDWVPQSTLHRPDGFSIYERDGKRMTIAFEAEFSPKAIKRFERVVTYYDSQETISLVLWLVDSKNTLNALKRNFQKFQMRQSAKHHFILLSDLKLRGWLAPIIDGQHKGRTLSHFLSHSPPTKASQEPLGCGTLALLDNRKRPIYSKSSPTPKNRPNP